MIRTITLLLLGVGATLSTFVNMATGAAGAVAAIRVHPEKRLGPIDPRIYGHFTEMTLSSFEGSLSSELLFNRKFEIQERRTTDPPVFTGVADGWEPMALDTHTTFVQDRHRSYSPSYSQQITLSDSTDVPAGIQQAGFRFVMPHISKDQRVEEPFRFPANAVYRVRLAVRSESFSGDVHVALGESWKQPSAQLSFSVEPDSRWRVFEGELTPARLVEPGRFMVYIEEPGTVWIDSVSLVEAGRDESGFRKDVLELTRRTVPTSIRWPGGWFVSDYQWEDGIGPVDERPARFNRAWNAYTTNDVGTDEFIELCRRTGAEPYLCVNLGTGSPEEAARWVEYCNGGPETEMGRLRAQNGHPEPYGVRDWNIGNEEYLPTLGGMSGRQYGRLYRDFARAMRAVDPSIRVVAVGAFDIPGGILQRTNPAWKFARFLPDWNRGVLEEAAEEIDYYSIHYYKPENVQGHDSDEVSRATLVIGEDFARKLARLQQQMKQFGGRTFPLALDEWSVAVRGESTPRALPPGAATPEQLGLQVGALTLRDALSEATLFNLMQRRPHDFALGSRTLLYAYLRGLIAVRRDQAIATPPALMLELYSTREVCQSLGTEVESETFDSQRMNPGFEGVKGAPYLDVSARLRGDGKTVDLFVVNRNLQEPVPATVRLATGSMASGVQAAILTDSDLLAWNTFEEPDRVSIERTVLTAEQGELHYDFPAHSLVVLTWRMR